MRKPKLHFSARQWATSDLICIFRNCFFGPFWPQECGVSSILRGAFWRYFGPKLFLIIPFYFPEQKKSRESGRLRNMLVNLPHPNFWRQWLNQCSTFVHWFALFYLAWITKKASTWLRVRLWKVYEKKAFSRKVWLLAYSWSKTRSWMKVWSLLFSWYKKAETSWDPACGNKSAFFLRRETIWGCV